MKKRLVTTQPISREAAVSKLETALGKVCCSASFLEEDDDNTVVKICLTDRTDLYKPREATPDERTAQLLVDCHFLLGGPWRLSNVNGRFSSWRVPRSVDPSGCNGIKRLEGRDIVGLAVSPQGFDLTLSFSDGYTLNNFCDSTIGDLELSATWTFFDWKHNLMVQARLGLIGHRVFGLPE